MVAPIHPYFVCLGRGPSTEHNPKWTSQDSPKADFLLKVTKLIFFQVQQIPCLHILQSRPKQLTEETTMAGFMLKQNPVKSTSTSSPPAKFPVRRFKVCYHHCTKHSSQCPECDFEINTRTILIKQ